MKPIDDEKLVSYVADQPESAADCKMHAAAATRNKTASHNKLALQCRAFQLFSSPKMAQGTAAAWLGRSDQRCQNIPTNSALANTAIELSSMQKNGSLGGAPFACVAPAIALRLRGSSRTTSRSPGIFLPISLIEDLTLWSMRQRPIKTTSSRAIVSLKSPLSHKGAQLPFLSTGHACSLFCANN